MFALKLAFRISLFLLLLWGSGYVAFIWHLESLRVEDRETKTDAIVVLTGGNFRIQTGLELFSRGLAPNLFITGVHATVKEKEILATWKGKENLPKCCLILGHKATTTLENAEETLDWATKNKIKSIRLVTSLYHMPRALIEFHAAMPDMIILANPVEETDYVPEDQKYWILTFSEYNKALFRKLTFITNYKATP